ncbi:MAG: hypothetical protein P1P81_05865 [Desulfobulbales bacterium]|nr:hypothetical protein [Desulfobulbales bacterium]
MRCPKCSFISFDDLTNCAKCSNDLAAIAQELHGTCTETMLPFFLSSVVQSPEPEDQTFSESQALPSIDDTDINFDETMDGDLSVPEETDQTLTDFDDSMEISEDDISLELGDIMPIDLDQLDQPGPFGDDLEDDDLTEWSADSQTGETTSLEEIDFNLGDDFGDQSSEFDATEILKTGQAEEGGDFDATGDFDQSIDLNLSGDFEGLDFDDTTIFTPSAEDAEQLNFDDTLSARDSFPLDEEFTSSLSDELPDLDVDQDRTEVLELDDSLFDELEETQIVQPVSEPELSGESEEPPAAAAGLESPAEAGEFRADDNLSEDGILLLDEEAGGASSPADDLSSEIEPAGYPELEDDMLEEFEPALVEKGAIDEIVAASQPGPDSTAFDLDDTGTDFGLEGDAEEFRADDTLSDDLGFALDEELEVIPAGEAAPDPVDAAASESFGSDDTILEELEAAKGAKKEQAADFPTDIGFGVETADFALEAEWDAEEDSPGPEDADRLGDELLATMDEELDFDPAELATGQDESGFSGGQVSEQERLGDEFVAGPSPALGLEDIDLSDLVADYGQGSEDTPADSDGDDAVLSASLTEEVDRKPGGELRRFDEDIPEFEVVEDDDEEGPPDLP